MKYGNVEITCTYLGKEGVTKNLLEWEQITKVSAVAIYNRNLRNTGKFWTNEQVVGLEKLTKRPAKPRKRYEASIVAKKKILFSMLREFNGRRLV